MSKYQKALYKLYNPRTINTMNPFGVEIPEEYELIQELVDKNKPMRPIIIFGNVEYEACPSCEEYVVEEYNYCHNCGQRIGWEVVK